jgi:hypothetical protein
MCVYFYPFNLVCILLSRIEPNLSNISIFLLALILWISVIICIYISYLSHDGGLSGSKHIESKVITSVCVTENLPIFINEMVSAFNLYVPLLHKMKFIICV